MRVRGEKVPEDGERAGGIYTYANAGREAGYNALEMEIGIDERGGRADICICADVDAVRSICIAQKSGVFRGIEGIDASKCACDVCSRVRCVCGCACACVGA